MTDVRMRVPTRARVLRRRRLAALAVAVLALGWGSPASGRTEPGPARPVVQAATGTGSISGTVTSGGTPVGGTYVSAYDPSTAAVAAAATDSAGRYVLTGLAPGQYRIQFAAGTTGLVPEYYDDALVVADADLVTVADGATVTGIDADLAAGGWIRGTVTGPDGPLQGVFVWAAEVTDAAYGFASTAADGSYVIDGLPPGSYRVGFMGADMRVEYYDDVLNWLLADVLALAEGQDLTGIDAVLAPEGGPIFSDVPLGAPFFAEIEWLAEWGITTGYPDGTFRPSAPVERQAMAAFLYRYLGQPEFTPPTTPTFTDVPVSSPFFTAIEWLAHWGITTGWPDGTFRPTASVERQAMAAFLYRMGGEPPVTPPTTATFSDVPTSAAFFDEVEWLADTGITTGWPDGTFRPAARVERQAMAAFLMRFNALR